MKILELIILAITILTFNACRKNGQEPDPQSEPLFHYQIIAGGDGKVKFSVDPKLSAPMYIWDFGDGSQQVMTNANETEHVFKNNKTYQIKLTATQGQNQATYIASIPIKTRLARTFNDLPADERDTIRILHVLTHDFFKKQFENPDGYGYNDYQNLLFANFLKRAVADYPREFDRLVFQNIFWAVSSEEMGRINNAGHPVETLESLLHVPADSLFQRILDKKRSSAASKVVFYLKDPAPGGASQYGFGGYASYDAGYMVCISYNSFCHELGHSFGFAHDTLRDCRYATLMMGQESKTSGTCGSIWREYPEIQVKGFTNNLVLLREPNYYEHAVPQYWQGKFPNAASQGSITLNSVATTPFYRSDKDLGKTLAEALIVQHNIRASPALVTSITENPLVPDGRPDANGRTKMLYCK